MVCLILPQFCPPKSNSPILWLHPDQQEQIIIISGKINGTNKKLKQNTLGRVHIASSGQNHYFLGLQGLVHSLLKHTGTPDLLTVHVFFEAPIAEDSATLLLWNHYRNWQHHLMGQFPGFIVEFHNVSRPQVQPFLPKFIPADNHRLNTTTNYVRFILHQVLPAVPYCIWMDSDIVVQGDIIQWGNRNIPFKDKPIAAFPREEYKCRRKINKSWNVTWVKRVRHTGTLRQELFCWDPLQHSYDRLRVLGLDVALVNNPRFNAGFLIFHLDFWRWQESLTNTIVQICEFNRNEKLPFHSTGSQAPLQFLFSGDRFHKLNPKEFIQWWGKTNLIPKVWEKATTSPAMFLHFNAQIKPWEPYAEKNSSLGPYVNLWENLSTF